MSNNLLTVMIAALLVSCSKEVVLTDDTPEPNSTLTIRTRAGDGDLAGTAGEAKISYPIFIYVFDESGKCSSVETMDEGDSEISTDLLEGSYNVCAVAGADASGYTLPPKETATPATPIELLDGASHGDLMTASNVVTLVDGGENTLTLTLVRRVMLVQNVEIDQVPVSVKSVSVTIEPLHETLCLDGTYTDGQAGVALELSNVAGTRTWKSADAAYCLEPSAEAATITVSMTGEDGVTHSYSYTCAEKLEANYKVNISGTYTEKAGVSLTGTIIGATWDGEKNISFDFDESGSYVSGGDAGQDNSGGGDGVQRPVIDDEPPAAGALYKGKYYVLRSEPSADGAETVVTLMTTEEKAGLVFDAADQASVRAAVDAAIREMADGTDGVTGWRLPTAEECDYIYDNTGEIVLDFSSFDKHFYPERSHFYQEDSETIGAKKFCNSDRIPYLSEETQLLAVTTVVFER